MTIGPILPGRLPTSLIASQMTDNINSVQDALATVEQQISSGQRFVYPSQDPTAATAVLSLQRQLRVGTQYQTNLTTDQSFLQSTDSAMQNVTQALSQANSLLLSGIGSTSTATQRQALAGQVDSIIQGLVSTANSTTQGRYLFGGSQSTDPPFAVLPGGVVRYNGDQFQINSYTGSQLMTPNNIDGVSAFGAISTPVGTDVDPAVTLQTNLSDLNTGRGVVAGQIQVTITNGSAVSKTVDLSHAQTVDDVKQLVENAFPPGTVTVGIVGGPPKNGLKITPAAGTVSIADTNGGRTAADLGIASTAAASISGSDLDPKLTLETPLSALNGGAGASLSHGIHITDGALQQTIDVSGDSTVQDLLNSLSTADPNLDVGINAAGNGLAISTRLSGVNFSIGENGGNDATSLGIRTLTGSTLLSGLNSGLGVPLTPSDSPGSPMPANLTLQLRDGSTLNVDLAGSRTVQDVLDKINTSKPGELVASLNSVGNGISLTDNDGVSTGPLVVQSTNISTALGIAGTESSSDPTQPLVGKDVNPLQANGTFNLLEQLSAALKVGDNVTLTHLGPLFQNELNRISGVQADLGSREQMLTQVKGQLQSSQTDLQSSLSDQFDTNMPDALTKLTQLSTSLQATLQVTANSMKLSLFNYI